jgi:hypothetical protein
MQLNSAIIGIIRVAIDWRNAIHNDHVTKYPMNYEIVMVTYRKDLEFASYTLRSIKKFGSGYKGITMVVPYYDAEMFEPLAQQHGVNLRKCLEQPGKGFLQHMACKCEADLWCPKGTDVVVHIDADCVFGEPFTMADFVDGQKPLLLREHFDDFLQHLDRRRWQHNVEHALGITCEWETMVRHPSVYHIDMYRRFRTHIEDRHGYPFHQYVILQRNEFPQTFSEFPSLGMFCLHFDQDRYRVLDCISTAGQYWANEKWREFGIAPVERDSRGVPTKPSDGYKYLWHMDDGSILLRDIKNPIRYFWSKRGVTPEYRQQIEAILAS